MGRPRVCFAPHPTRKPSAVAWPMIPPWPVQAPSLPGMLNLYTIQSREAYEALQCDCVLVGDSSRGWSDFQAAYAWMLGEMEARELPGADGGLLWLWQAKTRQDL